MFTGIIKAVGKVEALTPMGGDVRIGIDTRELSMEGTSLGDSICVNGCCLTVIEKRVHGFDADASKETLSLTTLGELMPGSPVNLETALTLSAPLGGHLVSGHVDGVGVIRARREEARSVRFDIEAPGILRRYIAHKGSVCVDGVSLTVNVLKENTFDVNIIPHTLGQTIFSTYRVDSRVNLEVDVMARYAERLLEERRS